MILDPTNSQHIDFNDWLAQCPVQWFKLDSDDDQRSYQFIIDTSEIVDSALDGFVALFDNLSHVAI